MTECIREREIAEAICAGRWPDACDEELWRHIVTCGSCGDVVIVAQALREERGYALNAAAPPAASLVWWRAELRARQEANRAAERPMKVVSAFSAACTLGVLVALMAGMLPWLRESLAVFGGMPRLGPLVLALAAVLVLAPLALYFAFSDE